MYSQGAITFKQQKMTLVNTNKDGVYWQNAGYFTKCIGRLKAQDQYEAGTTGVSTTVDIMLLEQSGEHTTEIATVGYRILWPIAKVRSLPCSCFFGLDVSSPVRESDRFSLSLASISQGLEVEIVIVSIWPFSFLWQKASKSCLLPMLCGEFLKPKKEVQMLGSHRTYARNSSPKAKQKLKFTPDDFNYF